MNDLLFYIDVFGDKIIGLIFVIVAIYFVYKFTSGVDTVKKVELKVPTQDLSSAKSVQEIVASEIIILGSYYDNVLSQSQRSFYFALAAAVIGLLCKKGSQL